MAEVKVLIEGYAKEINGGWLASSAATLIRVDGKNIIVDPGCNRERLLSALSVEDLKTTDIDYVVLTHTHTDHALLAGIFEKAKVINDSEIYTDDNQVEHEGLIPGTKIKIIPTPGHDQFHCSLIVDDDNLGRVCVAGDLFWWKDDQRQGASTEELLNLADPYVKDENILRKSREEVLRISNYIIPGHGKMFKVEK